MPDPYCSAEAGCADGRHFCTKGFPDGTIVMNHKAKFRGRSDYKVLLYAVRMFRDVSRTNSRTQYAIFTSDRKFWKSAKHQFDSLNGRAPRHIKFTQSNFVTAWVVSGGKRYRIRIRVVYISRTMKKKASKKKLDPVPMRYKPAKKRILSKSIQYAEQLLE